MFWVDDPSTASPLSADNLARAERYLTATAGANGDFYVTVPNGANIASGDLIHISFPTATVGTATARLSVNGGTTYRNISQGKTAIASSVQDRILLLRYTGSVWEEDKQTTIPVLIDAGDCDTITAEWHLGGNSGTNYPTNLSGAYYYVHNIFYTSTRQKQIAYSYTLDDIYTRRYYNSAWTPWVKMLSVNDSGLKNQSITSQTGFSSETYLSGSYITFPDAPKVGTTYKLIFDVTKTAAGTATPIINIKTGTAGTTADTTRCSAQWGAGTAAVDSGVFEVICTFRSVGASTSAVIQSVMKLTSNLEATGISTNIKAKQVTSSGFDSTTASLGIGASYNGGTSAAHTIQLVRAELIM